MFANNNIGLKHLESTKKFFKTNVFLHLKWSTAPRDVIRMDTYAEYQNIPIDYYIYPIKIL